MTVTEADGSSELRIGPRLLMVVTQRDAASIGVSRVGMATQFARDIETAVRAERMRYEPGTLARSGIYGLVATIAFALLLWIISRFIRLLRRALTRFRPAPEGPSSSTGRTSLGRRHPPRHRCDR